MIFVRHKQRRLTAAERGGRRWWCPRARLRAGRLRQGRSVPRARRPGEGKSRAAGSGGSAQSSVSTSDLRARAVGLGLVPRSPSCPKGSGAPQGGARTRAGRGGGCGDRRARHPEASNAAGCGFEGSTARASTPAATEPGTFHAIGRYRPKQGK